MELQREGEREERKRERERETLHTRISEVNSTVFKLKGDDSIKTD